VAQHALKELGSVQNSAMQCAKSSGLNDEVGRRCEWLRFLFIAFESAYLITLSGERWYLTFFAWPDLGAARFLPAMSCCVMASL